MELSGFDALSDPPMVFVRSETDVVLTLELIAICAVKPLTRLSTFGTAITCPTAHFPS
jgi:hypothetical protein